MCIFVRIFVFVGFVGCLVWEKVNNFNRTVPIWHRIVKLIIDNTLVQNVTICVIVMER